MSDRRWPRSVYGTGDEPDYRYSFANERTFLAWIRTALAMIAAGVALDTLDLDMPDGLRIGLAVLFVILGLLCSLAAWVRWALSERAMRHNRPLPSLGVGTLLTLALIATTLVLIAFAL